MSKEGRSLTRVEKPLTKVKKPLTREKIVGRGLILNAQPEEISITNMGELGLLGKDAINKAMTDKASILEITTQDGSRDTLRIASDDAKITAEERKNAITLELSRSKKAKTTKIKSDVRLTEEQKKNAVTAKISKSKGTSKPREAANREEKD